MLYVLLQSIRKWKWYNANQTALAYTKRNECANCEILFLDVSY